VVRLWDWRQGVLLAEPLRADAWVTAVALSHDGRHLVAGWSNRTVSVWDRVAGRRSHTWDIAGGPRALAFTGDGRTVLTAGNHGTVYFRGVADGEAIGKPLVHQGPLLAAAFAPDGETVVTVAEDGWVRRWDWKAGKVLSAVKQDRPPLVAAIRPDARSVLTAPVGPHAQLWAVADGAPQGPPLSHSALSVQRLCLSDDGATALTSAENRAARLWDVTTGRPLGPHLFHASDVFSLGFVPGRGSAVTAVKAGPVIFWNLPAPVSGGSESVRLQVELLTATACDAHGVPHELGAAALSERRQRLEKLGGLSAPK
jgi:WD40 repeat protein